MRTISLLYSRYYPINDNIRIVIPSMGEILEDEDSYYTMVTLLTAMPIDMMVQLDDMGIDFSEISDYEMFLLMFPALQSRDTSLIFGDTDLTKFELAVDEGENMVMVDTTNDIVIDRVIYGKIAGAMRKIHHLEKNKRKPGNGAAKKFMLERARAKARRYARTQHDSQVERLIIAMVNTEQFKYNFSEVKSLSVYQFNESVRQVVRKVDYDNRMHGVYSGTISVKDLPQEDLNWLVPKK